MVCLTGWLADPKSDRSIAGAARRRNSSSQIAQGDRRDAFQWAVAGIADSGKDELGSEITTQSFQTAGTRARAAPNRTEPVRPGLKNQR